MASRSEKNTGLERRVKRIEQRLKHLQLLDSRFSWARLIIFIAGIVMSAAFFSIELWPGWLALLLAIIAFSFTVSQHRKVRRTIAQFEIWREIKLTHIARLDLNWSKLPPPLPPFPDQSHPFEADLDVTGSRSLHHLLDTAVSLEGSLRLRDRLLTIPSDISVVMERQALVRELLPLSYFRDRLGLDTRLAVLPSRQRWEAHHLLKWFENPGQPPRLRQTLWLSAIIAVLNIVLLVLNRAGVLPPLWAVSLLIYLGLFFSQAQNLIELFDRAMSLYDILTPLVEVSYRMEKTGRKDKPRLQQWLRPFHTSDRPSIQLRRLSRLAGAASLRGNPMVWLLLNVLLPWDLFIAYQLNRYRQDMAARVPVWLDTWLELEIACSFATFADLNPAYRFPAVNDTSVLQARGLGHPLIPAHLKVSNDFSIDRLGEVILITGSNMSGKSSFLRTLGINLCLAYSGCVVSAESLEVNLFRIFTCIRVNDSLADGFSYFYAEVRRLRALLTALESDHPLPLCFLIDEIFRATNNQERLIGSHAYLRALVGRHGVGAVSTHDLELTTIQGLSNYHFEDQVVEGEMKFDYRLRPGPSPTTNALKIMRLAGLPVEDKTT